MKRIIFMAMAAFLMSASVPVYADNMTNAQKDECLLVSKECKSSVDSIQQKIEKLKAEINKGAKVYSPGEIKKLNDKLKEAETLVDNLLTN